MLGSGIRSVSKILPTVLRAPKKTFVQSTRNSGGGRWLYRSVSQPGPYYKLGEFGYVVMWWWFLYHLFTEYHILLPEFPLPDPALWTNEELGVPPDDED